MFGINPQDGLEYRLIRQIVNKCQQLLTSWFLTPCLFTGDALYCFADTRTGMELSVHCRVEC